MAHSRKQQGQYRKIIKDDNTDSSDSLVYSSIIPSILPSSSIPSSSIPSTPLSSIPRSSSSTPSSTSSTSVIPMHKDQFKIFLINCVIICMIIYMDNYIIILNLRF